MTKKKKIIIISACAAALLVILGVVLALVLGKEDEKKDPDKEAGGDTKTTYTIQVQDEDGKAFADLGIYVYTDSTKAELVTFAKTDAEGKITFTDTTCDGYIAVLHEVPEGYLADETYPITGDTTKIVLAADPNAVKDVYTLGDTMGDFTVKAADGTEYTLSELLKEKDAVVLNFWFENCGPCRAEFPYLQEAYEEYSDKIAVIAMNPVDGDDASIAEYATELGLTFPMAKCDAQWEKMLRLEGYPTTVVIDRYGKISLIHMGSIPDAQIFKNAFAFFTAEDYEHQILTDITELVMTEVGQGTEENPLEFGGVTEFEVKAEAGQVVYCNVYKVSGMTMKVESENTYVIYGGETIYPENGVITLPIVTPDTFTPVLLGFGNAGSEAETFKVSFVYEPGTSGNPLTLNMGTFNTDVAAGNEQGVFYTYVATEDGVVTLQCLSATNGVEYDYVLYNLNTYAYKTLSADGVKDSDTGDITLSIAVNKGDTLQLTINTLPDSSNEYPAGEFESLAIFMKNEESVDPGEGDGEGGDSQGGNEVSGTPTVTPTPSNKEITYTATVTDDLGNPISGVSVKIDSVALTTDASGVVTTVLKEGNYTVTVTIPTGYLKGTTQYQVTASKPAVAIQLVPEMTGTTEIIYPGGEETKAYVVGTGDTLVTMLPDDVTYFIFTPSKSGTYKITTDNSSAKVCNWATTAYVFKSGSEVKSYTLNVKPGQFDGDGNCGTSYVIGVTGVSRCNLQITRTGAAKLDETDVDWTVYKATTTPKAFTLSLGAGQSLKYFDLTAKTSEYTLVYSATDKYYHLNSESGPIVYVNLGEDAPYVSFSEFLANGTGIRRYFYDSNGDFVKKEDYTSCMQKYVDCMDENTGVYPLTDDLIYIIQQYGDAAGWWNKTDDGFYLFEGVSGVNTEIAWMFALCYAE